MRFDEIFVDDTKNVFRINSKEFKDKGKIAIVDQSKNLIAGYTDVEYPKVCHDERIIFGDHTRIFKYIDFPFVCGADGTKVLKLIDNDKISYKYIYYYLLSTFIPNTGYNRHFKWVKELKFKIPEYDVQLEIVKKLDKTNELIELKKKQITSLNKMIKSQFIEMFGDLEKNSKGYEIKSMSEIAKYWNGLTYKPSEVCETGTIVLRSSNIQDSVLDYNDIVRVNSNIADKKYVKENDILMCSRNGSAKLVGKVALIPKSMEKMAFGAFMMVIRSDYYPYLYLYFQTNAFRKQIVSGATTTINQITTNIMNNVKLPIPKKSEVNKYNEFLKQAEKQKYYLEESLKKLEELRSALMQEYFG